MAINKIEQNWRDINFSAFDGLKLYARHYESAVPSLSEPLICLPGLTRNSQDFHYLAEYYTKHQDTPRDVFCVDYRGRGQSEYDRNWQNYTPMTELNDLLALTTIESIHKAILVGTSRGGLISMLLGAIRPTLIKAVILNDIGPVIETEGLLRLRSYVGSTPPPKDWDEAVHIVKSINQQQFPHLKEQEWMQVAKQLYLETEGQPMHSYDSDLSKSLSMIDFVEGIPSMWPQFESLTKFPLLTIRGENSDILSQKTLNEMKERMPTMEIISVKDQGHAPLLNSEEIHKKIDNFLSTVH